jgi:rhodanese-related sulfurtransferase
MNFTKKNHEHIKVNRFSVSKKLSLLLIGLLLIPSLLLTSCDRGDDIIDSNATPAFTLMKEYMFANNLDLNNVLDGPAGAIKFVAGAPADAGAALDAFLAKYYIIDIRSSTDFANGHIQGAKNVAFGDILTDAPNAGGKPILVVCYTGQTACFATSLLRMYNPDYNDTQALKWGMSGWNSATADPWNNAIGNPADGNANWIFSGAPSTTVFSDPTLSSFSTDGSEILKDRVEEIVAGGFKGVEGIDVLTTPSNYFINNFCPSTDYLGFGHIDGAFNINPLLLADNSYQNLDPGSGAKVVTYCYTGQTSAVLTAWLRVLGYDAYSLKFGVNGLFNSSQQWSTNQWGVGSSVPKNLPLVN